MTIDAKIIAYSKSAKGQTIVTWELQYPRFIHSEFLTHRLFSRNAASSRAIPVKSMIAQVMAKPAAPVHWGKNQPGMQAHEELEDYEMAHVMYLWEEAAYEAAMSAGAMDAMGAHKQIVNRLLEPFQTMKTVMTATCMDNFFWLRNHEDAQPEIKVLARLMWEALEAATPFKLSPGDWHVPYYNSGVWKASSTVRSTEGAYPVDEFGHSLENALAISSSCCAQVSYRRLDDTLEKAQMIFQRLVESEPVHASPFEHQATPMKWGKLCKDTMQQGWEDGVTHMDRGFNFWSGNFIGWIQHRQLIPNNVCKEYKG